MNIKQLKIYGFGKFINKDIQFNKGINVIYGDNETGKSTVHKFIESVLFGIDSSDDDTLKKYQPWFSDDYKGQIELKENNNEYLVFRDFKSNYTSFNDEEVNDDNPNSIKQPGYQLLGVNRDIYRNTLSIGQLNSKTDRELLKEIKNKIENLGKAKDENISVENVLKRLDEKVDNKKYQEVQDRIKELHLEKSNIENNKSNIVNYINEISKHKEALKELYERKELLNPLTTVDDFDELENKYISSEKIINEINKLTNEIDSMKKNMDIEIEDYEQLILLSSKNEKLEDEQKDLMKNLESLEKEAIYIKNDFQKFKNVDESNFISQYELYKSNKKILERLQTKLDDLTDEIQEINDKNNKGVISSFNELAKEKKRKKYINGILEGNIVDILKEKLKKERNRKWFKIIISLFILLGVRIGSYLAVNYYQNTSIYYANAVVLVGFFILSKLSRNNTIIKNLKQEIKEINAMVPEYKEECEKLENHKKEILEKYNCVDTKDLKSLYYDAIDNQKSLEEKNKTYETLQEEIFYLNKKCKEIEEFLHEYLDKFGYDEINDENIKSLNKKYNESEIRYSGLQGLESEIGQLKEKKDSLLDEIEKNKKEINKILEDSGVKSKDEFKEAFKLQNILKEKVSTKNNKEEVLRNILQDEDFEEIKTKYNSIVKLKEEENFSSFQEIKEEKAIEEEEIDRNNKVIEKYKKDIENAENNRRLYLVEEEISDLSRIIKNIEEMKSIIEITKSNILETSRKIKEEFMPELEKNLGKYFNILTDDRYKEVSIEDSFAIEVKESEEDRFISLDNLSLGTIDQMYFSLRFSLIDIMFSNSEIPIILDDCFTQYDDDRLRNALDIITKIKDKYQILLFTCHKREEQFLRELGQEINLVQL
jgi:uncharacterized protein YhaN